MPRVEANRPKREWFAQSARSLATKRLLAGTRQEHRRKVAAKEKREKAKEPTKARVKASKLPTLQASATTAREMGISRLTAARGRKTRLVES